MRKLVFFLVFRLCVSVTLQQKGGVQSADEHKNIIRPNPRSFIGHVGVVNRTQYPNSTSIVQLRSNGTVEYLSGTLSTTVIPIIYLFIITLGVPANIAILSTLATKLRKVSSAILYCSLAVSDLFLLISLFFKAHYHFHRNNWGLGETACRVVTACFYGNLYCSAQTLACISIKRYLALVHPFMYKALPKRMCTAWISLTVWGVFGAAIVPNFLVQQTYLISELGITTCHDVLPLNESSHKFLVYYNLVLTIFGLMVPLVVTIVCHARIICELNRSNLDWAMYIKASTLVFVIFLVCFIPASLLHVIHYVKLSVSRVGSFYMYFNMAVCLCCLHACLDPFLFLIMSKSAGSRVYFRPFKGKSISISI